MTPNDGTPARFSLGNYELRAHDHSQILLWAKALELEPAGIVQRLEGSFCARGDRSKLTFSVENGSIVTLAWDFDLLPLSVFEWVDGLAIREIGFKGKPKAPPQVSLRLQFLVRLDCSAIDLIDLDLSNVPKLTDLQCHSNQLAALDLSNVPHLTMLWCHTNHFTKLDLTNVPRLAHFSCSDNQLTNLDLSKVPGLAEFACANNQLTELDLSNVAGLTHLSCETNQLTELDLSNMARLIELDCAGNQLSSLDLSNVPVLRDLICSDNQLTGLDLSKVAALRGLFCENNKLTELDLSTVPALTALFCEKNKITELDVRSLEKLINFECDPFVTVKKRSTQQINKSPEETHSEKRIANQLESTTAKHQSALAEISRLATSSEFRKCARLAAEYVYLVSSDYGMLTGGGDTVIQQLEKLLVNPEKRLGELNHFIILYLNLKEPTTFPRQRLEYDIAKTREEIIRAKTAFFGSVQKTEHALRRLKSQEKRLARFVELESQVVTWRTTLELFVEHYNKVLAAAKAQLSAKSRHQKKIEFEKLHGIAYAKASALDARTRQRASSNRNHLEVTANCPYCNRPLGNSPHADHIYPVSRGGLSTIENMVFCCQACNSLKADRGLIEFLMAEGRDIDLVYETLRLMGKRI